MRRLRVGVDATSWNNRRGYGRFARNAVSSLIESYPETSFSLYADGDSAAELNAPPAAEIVSIPMARVPSRAAAANSSRPVADMLRLTRAVEGRRPDVFLFPSVYTYFPVLRVPTVVGVHDAIADELPALTLPTRRARAFWRAKERLALRLATELFTVSVASRAVLTRRFGLSASRLTVVSEAPDPVFVARPRDEVRRVLSTMGLAAETRFLLYAGGISPHKNIETLIDAYAALARGRGELPLLVVVGDLGGDPYLSSGPGLQERVARLGLRRSVLFPGFVSDETLACLYTAAEATVVPSMAEGFGLPAVEAAACGTPVILSDLPAHRETMDEAALYFPATDAPALAGVLAQIVDDAELRTSLADRGRRSVGRLSWDATASRLRDLLVRAVG